MDMGVLRDYDTLKPCVERLRYLEETGALPRLEDTKELYWFFAEGEIAIWCNGQRYGKVEAGTQQPVKKELRGRELRSIQSRHIERRQQQAIALKHFPTAKNPLDVAVLGAEFTFHEDMIPGPPEMDFLIVDRRSKPGMIYLTEYKCDRAIATDGGADLRKHWRDMKIMQREFRQELQEDAAVSYALYTGMAEVPDFSDYEIKIAFLSTDMNGKIGKDGAAKLNGVLDEIAVQDPDVVLWDFPNVAAVDLRELPKPIGFRFAPKAR